MPSIWKTDRIAKDNTLEKEVARLKRIVVALDLAFLEKRYKHVHRDISELYQSIEEIEHLIESESND